MRRTFLEAAYSSWLFKRAAFGLASIASVVVLAGCAINSGTPEPVVKPVQPAAPVVKAQPKPPKIGLALGGGAARGFAHIGVLQVLEENGIKPDYVVGTSAGSLVATLYAAGHTPTQLGQIAMTLDESIFTDWTFPGRSLLKGEALAKYVRTTVNGRQIENMKVPLGIVAAELKTGKPILFRRGDAGVAVRASSAVPGVFSPVSIGGHEYIDGGVVSPVPVRYARQMGGEVVIAVDISAIPEGQATRTAIDILLQTVNIMGHSISQWELAEADVVMRPKLSGIGSADFGNRRLSILAGREAALSVLPQLQQAIRNKTR